MAKKKQSERDKAVHAALDELLKGHRPEDILNEGGLVQGRASADATTMEGTLRG